MKHDETSFPKLRWSLSCAMEATVQSLCVKLPLYGSNDILGPLTLHCGSLVGTGSATEPEFHVVKSIRFIRGSYRLSCYEVWGWDAYAAAYRRKRRRDPGYADSTAIEKLTSGLDKTKELFVTERASEFSLTHVKCLATLYDCGMFRQMMTKGIQPRPYMFWSLMEVDIDVDLVTLTADEHTLYKYSWLNSDIHQAPDAEVGCYCPGRCCNIADLAMFQALALVIGSMAAKKDKMWRVAHAHQRYVITTKDDAGNRVQRNGKPKFLLQAEVPGEYLELSWDHTACAH
jgi:hypothetical protein